MASWLPEATPATLIPPNRDHPFFNFALPHPFEFEANEYSATNAAWLADLALLAYDDPPHVARGLHSVNFKLSGRQPVVTSGGLGSAQVYVAHDEHDVFVAFRGTEIPTGSSTRGYLQKTFDAVQDTLTNVRLKLVPFDHHGRAHSGFVTALDSVWERLLTGWIRPLASGPEHRRVWFTGHSLGGAMAVLAALRYGDAAGVYTFGAPRVGDAALSDAVAKLPAWRIVLREDVVTRVPPSAPPPALKWVPNGYCHAGQPLFIHDDGTASVDAVNGEELPAGIMELAVGISSPVEAFSRTFTHREGITELFDTLLCGSASRDARAFAHAVYDHAPLYYALSMRHLVQINDAGDSH
jgi:triacylglycerol lipase